MKTSHYLTVAPVEVFQVATHAAYQSSITITLTKTVVGYSDSPDTVFLFVCLLLLFFEVSNFLLIQIE